MPLTATGPQKSTEIQQKEVDASKLDLKKKLDQERRLEEVLASKANCE